jgi:FMN-dependent oxidoreductase (nitrilotriacetate monooxygenase family)
VSQPRREMHLGLFLLPPGHHVAAWRHPRTPADGDLDFDYLTTLAKTAERGLFDMLFLSDGLGVRINYADAVALSKWGHIVYFEPITLLSALAKVTTSIGLAATSSATYHEPFNTARQFASLDWLSRGRAAWNIVTSMTDAEAQNFNLDRQPDHDARYRRAHEFLEVATGLWDSWDDSAFVYDKSKGRSFEPGALHILDHRGEFFSVRGPLNIARCPQGRPVLIQAGSSAVGQDFAARWADVIFTAQDNIVDAKQFYSATRARLAAHNRDENAVRVLPGVCAVIGRTVAEAEDKFAELQDLVDSTLGLGLLTGLLGGIDLAQIDPDDPLPQVQPTQGGQSRQSLLLRRAARDGLSIRELYMQLTATRGHLFVLGDPVMVADTLEEWFRDEACDGFNFMPAQLPDGLNDFVTLVIPELQKRGLFRTAYTGSTLRDHLGLLRPALPRFRA